MARYRDDHGGGSDEDHDFVDLVPPPAERYDPEWRLKPPEYPPRCPHCKNWIGNAASDVHQQHVLNGCRTFSSQGRYRWRHTAVLHYVDSLMDRKTLRVYSDLPERRTEQDMTVPEQLLGPAKFEGMRADLLKPDMVFFSRSFDDDSAFTVGVLEISLPWDVRVEASRSEKQQKNRALVEALTEHTRTPVVFLSLEVGSFHQRLSEGTKASIKELYTFTDQSVPYRTFKHRIIRLAEFASFQLYSTRFEPDWMAFSPYLELPPELCDPDADKDNISSESGEAISVSSANSSGCSSGVVILTPHHPPHEDIERPSQPPPLPPTTTAAMDLLQSAPAVTTAAMDLLQSAPAVTQSEPKCEKPSSLPPVVVTTGQNNQCDLVRKEEGEEVPTFSPRTKACIYASGAALVAYIVYNYWHLILACLLCLLMYEVWDKFGHRFTVRKAKSD